MIVFVRSCGPDDMWTGFGPRALSLSHVLSDDVWVDADGGNSLNNLNMYHTFKYIPSLLLERVGGVNAHLTVCECVFMSSVHVCMCLRVFAQSFRSSVFVLVQVYNMNACERARALLSACFCVCACWQRCCCFSLSRLRSCDAAIF